MRNVCQQRLARACPIGMLTLFFGGCATPPAHDGSTRMGPGVSYYQFYDNSHFGDEARIDDSRSAHINKPPAQSPPVPIPAYDFPRLP